MSGSCCSGTFDSVPPAKRTFTPMLFGVRDSSIANALRGNEIAEFEARRLRAFFSLGQAGGLNTPRFLDNENAGLAARVRHMLAADTGKENVAGFQRRDLLFADFAVM